MKQNLTPLCQSEQQIPQRPASTMVLFGGREEMGCGSPARQSRAKLQSRAVLWVVEQHKEGFGGLHNIQVWQSLFQANLVFLLFLEKLIFLSSSSVGSHLMKGNLLLLILLPPEVCCVSKVTDVPHLLEGEYFSLSP